MPTEIHRRRFLGSLAGAATAGCAGETPDSRPNIVVIMADDMGFSDLGSYGGEIETPHLDALAEGGLRFRQFYNAGRCCPTRASLLTGLYPHQAGVGHMVSDLGRPAYQGHLNSSCVTIAEALKGAGYATLMAGKWHVGEQRPHWPADRGFDEYFGLISGGSNYFKLDGARTMALGNAPYTPPDDGTFYMTDAFSDHAARFIRERGGNSEPLLLYLAYTAPHWPLHAKPQDIAKYAGRYGAGWDALRRERFERQARTGIRAASWSLSPRDPDVPAWSEVGDKALWERRMEVYAAMVDCLDQGVGRVVRALQDTGRFDNTLILFLSDNGGCHESADIPRGTPRNTWGDPDAMPGGPDTFDGYDRPWANASNTPWRLFKSWMHEGGIASPLICHWPAGIRTPPGSVTDAPGHVIDVMATCIDLAEAKYPGGRAGRAVLPLEGRSLRPVLETGARAGHEAIFWEHQGNRAVRMGRWKLVSRRRRSTHQAGRWELYDLERDRSELRDLAGELPGRVAELEAAWLEWGARVGWVPFDELRT